MISFETLHKTGKRQRTMRSLHSASPPWRRSQGIDSIDPTTRSSRGTNRSRWFCQKYQQRFWGLYRHDISAYLNIKFEDGISLSGSIAVLSLDTQVVSSTRCSSASGWSADLGLTTSFALTYQPGTDRKPTVQKTSGCRDVLSRQRRTAESKSPGPTYRWRWAPL